MVETTTIESNKNSTRSKKQRNRKQNTNSKDRKRIFEGFERASLDDVEIGFVSKVLCDFVENRSWGEKQSVRIGDWIFCVCQRLKNQKCVLFK